MLDRKLIRQEPDKVRAAIARKGLDAPVDAFLETDQAWRAVTLERDQLKAEMNQASKSIGQLMGQGKKEEAEAAKSQTAELKAKIKELDNSEAALEEKLRAIELDFPNMAHESCPDGEDENDNPVVRVWGEKPVFAEEPVPHWDIAEEHNLIDFERASKVSGSGFAIYKGLGAKLQRALIQFMLDTHTARGYEEIYAPALVTSDSLVGTGNLPKFADDLYQADEDLWLIPTGEVPLTNFFRDEILDGTDLPTKFAGHTPCFRREAGAAGRDTRGIQRMHQFEKVELVKFVLPERSYDALEELVQDAEAVLQALNLHYRVIELCAGDIGAKGCKAYDLEVWAPGIGEYLEVSSCTNFEDYQARRSNIRFRREPGGKPEFVHILNGSGTALPRLMIAILESNRLANGDIVIPQVLEPYLGGLDVISSGD